MSPLSQRTRIPLVLIVILLAQTASAHEAREIARKILEAQGGAEPWQAAPTISYDHELIFGGQGMPWISREVVDRATRRVYQDWPNQGSKLAYDGNAVWTVDWNLGNPPKVMPYLTFNTITAPWLLLLPDVEVDGASTGKLPGDETEYVTVTLRLPQDPARPPVAVYYKMYADPRSYALRATAYAVNYGALLDGMGLPSDVAELGPMIHVFDEWTDVDGLRLPVKYHTIGADGGIYGQHTVKNWALDRKFDEARMNRPENGVLDMSSHLRAKK